MDVDAQLKPKILGPLIIFTLILWVKTIKRLRILTFSLRRWRSTRQDREIGGRIFEGETGYFEVEVPHAIVKHSVCSLVYRSVFEDERHVHKDLQERACSAAGCRSESTRDFQHFIHNLFIAPSPDRPPLSLYNKTNLVFCTFSMFLKLYLFMSVSIKTS